MTNANDEHSAHFFFSSFYFTCATHAYTLFHFSFLLHSSHFSLLIFFYFMHWSTRRRRTIESTKNRHRALAHSYAHLFGWCGACFKMLCHVSRLDEQQQQQQQKSAYNLCCSKRARSKLHLMPGVVWVFQAKIAQMIAASTKHYRKQTKCVVGNAQNLFTEKEKFIL